MDKNKCPNSKLKKKFYKNFPGHFLVFSISLKIRICYFIYKITKTSSKIDILGFRCSKLSFLDDALYKKFRNLFLLLLYDAVVFFQLKKYLLPVMVSNIIIILFGTFYPIFITVTITGVA